MDKVTIEIDSKGVRIVNSPIFSSLGSSIFCLVAQSLAN